MKSSVYEKGRREEKEEGRTVFSSSNSTCLSLPRSSLIRCFVLALEDQKKGAMKEGERKEREDGTASSFRRILRISEFMILCQGLLPLIRASGDEDGEGVWHNIRGRL